MSMSMSKFNPIFFIWVILLLSFFIMFCSSSSWCPHYHIRKPDHREFQQKTTKFWEFEQKSNTWVEVKVPYDLVSCINDNCTIVGSIDPIQDEKQNLEKKKKKNSSSGDNSVFLALRKRVSLIKMSETSIWITGESGSIYERFWNGLQWVIAPHELPVSAGYAVSVFIVNQTILALSEAGILYQMQLSENSQPMWVEFTPMLDHSARKETERETTAIQLKSGVISNDRERIYFCVKGGWLLELSELEPRRWINHGKPPGADVAAIADAASIRPQVIFTVSSSGDLYEFDRNSKPSWKKHIWSEELAEDCALIPSAGCTLQGTSGPNSISLFHLTKGGNLVERRLHQRKWKWIIHGSPKDHHLTSITPVLPDESNEKSFSLFLTTSVGFVFEYHIPKQGIAHVNQVEENWINHMHPQHAKVAKGIRGLQFQMGRIIFPLDDGRLGELHQPGTGGKSAGPSQQAPTRRRASMKYIWSILDAPESEGWNAEYSTEERGPSNCILGIKDELDDAETIRSTSMRRRVGNNKAQEYYYLSSSAVSGGTFKEEYNLKENSVNTNFRLRVMHEGRSFFLVTDGGMAFEYLNTENMWIWHEYSTAMKGAVGNYNGSLFLVDEHRDLIVRERSGNELAWINCTAMRKGRQVISGPPWDLAPGKTPRVTAQDSLFFVSKSGRLLQLIERRVEWNYQSSGMKGVCLVPQFQQNVALRKFKWKDCRGPSNTKIASIVDKEVFRENIVFVVGRNGRLYQYNKVTELWHVHYQSQHMVLSRLPGTAMRPSSQSLTGSLFMISEDGKLIEYHWNLLEGWNWVEHGTPCIGVTLVGSTGPCFGGNQLFLIGSDGKVYIRYLDQPTWKWGDCGFPHMGNKGEKPGKEEVCIEADFTPSFENIYQENQHDTNNNCDPKVASTRPIPFMEDSVIFELRDGRLAEMRRTEDRQHWVWWRTIGTPTSFCNVHYWTTVAS